MGLEIESAADGNKLLINEQGRALVDSQTRKRSFYVSRDDARVFNTIFEDANAVAGEFVPYFRNTHRAETLSSNSLVLEALTQQPGKSTRSAVPLQYLMVVPCCRSI